MELKLTRQTELLPPASGYAGIRRLGITRRGAIYRAQGKHVARLGRDESRPYTRIATVVTTDFESPVGAGT